jgi:hypothetical protein
MQILAKVMISDKVSEMWPVLRSFNAMTHFCQGIVAGVMLVPMPSQSLTSLIRYCTLPIGRSTGLLRFALFLFIRTAQTSRIKDRCLTKKSKYQISNTRSSQTKRIEGPDSKKNIEIGWLASYASQKK